MTDQTWIAYSVGGRLKIQYLVNIIFFMRVKF